MPKSRDDNVHALTDREINLSARMMIAEYGANAESRVMRRIMQMQEIGNTPGAAAWSRILDAVHALRAAG